MGFAEHKVKQAIHQSAGDPEQALELLLTYSLIKEEEECGGDVSEARGDDSLVADDAALSSCIGGSSGTIADDFGGLN